MDTLTVTPLCNCCFSVFFKQVWKLEQRYQTHMARAMDRAFREYFSEFNWVENNGVLTRRPIGCKRSSLLELSVDVYHAENLLFLPSDPTVLKGVSEIAAKGRSWQISVTCNDGNFDRILFRKGNFYLASRYFASEEGQKELGVPK